ncbi:putative late blight resistance protein -like protein R1B-17-like [Capsicum annuum]|nr:putative late blight resistance protein -like protein R1B-17-like [Capsicum annuum]
MYARNGIGGSQNQNFKKNFTQQCDFCKLKVHSKENCWKLIGYPQDYKAKKKFNHEGTNTTYNVSLGSHEYSVDQSSCDQYAGDGLKLIEETKEILHQNFRMKNRGELRVFLGIEFVRFDKGILMHQIKYALELLSKLGLTTAKLAATPMDYNIKLTSNSLISMSSEDSLPPANQVACQKLITFPLSTKARSQRLTKPDANTRFQWDAKFGAFVFAVILERFPCVSGESLEYLNLEFCSSLEIFPEVMGKVKPSSIEYLTQGELHLGNMENLVALPSSIWKLKCLVKLDMSYCFKVESLPEEIDGGLLKDIGCLHSLEELTLSGNNFEYFPQSIAQLSALRFLGLSHCKKINFELIVGMKNLEALNLSYCNLIDGELPDDIGCLSSLKELNLSGNNFGHLPRRIAELGALRCLDLSHCKRLTRLPEFPVLLDTIEADWTNYWICNSLFQNISLVQHDISASDSLSLRVITGRRWHGMPTFPYQGTDGVSVNLPENWYIHDSFLGFAVCYHGILTDITAHLIPLYDDDGMSCITRKLVLSNHSEYAIKLPCIHFFLIPFTGLWDISTANGKTPNDYGHIMLSFSKKEEYEFRSLYKDELMV